MQNINFVTGNTNKFDEARLIIPELQRIEVDLPEEQTLDPKVVITKKLEVAKKHTEGKLIVEDTSLYLDGLNGFPGPLIKWMLKAVNTDGIYDLTSKIHNRRAVAKTVIGFDDRHGAIKFFEGSVSGQIVEPSGIEGFDWDDIFMPDGLNETFAEMGVDFKSEFSMRTIAFRKLKKYLEDVA